VYAFYVYSYSFINAQQFTASYHFTPFYEHIQHSGSTTTQEVSLLTTRT